MVKFFLVSTADNIATYEYYPEDDRSKKGGIITLDIISGEMTLIMKAEMGFISAHSDAEKCWASNGRIFRSKKEK